MVATAEPIHAREARILLTRREAMTPITRRMVHGAVAGALGAASMTVLRMLALRAKVVDQMLPQAVETWLAHRLPLRLPAGPNQRAMHHLLDQLLHLGYGASLGALYGLTLGRGRARASKTLGYATGVWAFGSFFLLPALRIMRPEWRAKPGEIAVNVSAHLTYAAVLALLTEELERQSFVQPLHYPLSLAASTG